MLQMLDAMLRYGGVCLVCVPLIVIVKASAETQRILAAGSADAEKIKADGDAYRIRETARAQEEAGKMLERTPVAVTIRLAEAAAHSLSTAGLVVAPDVSTQALLALLGTSSQMMDRKKHQPLAHDNDTIVVQKEISIQ
jgi:hypothetical protein